MGSVNKVTLLGRLGKDPEVRATQSGDKIANFNLATSETWKDKQGEKKEATEWHRIVIFGKLAEVVEKYTRKGDQIYIEGKLVTRKWEDKGGETRYTTEVQVTSIGGKLVMLQSKDSDRRPEPPPSDAPEHEMKMGKPKKISDDPPFDDEIPF